MTVVKKYSGVHTMKITDIRVVLHDDEKLRAFVSITLDNAFVIRGLKIIRGSKGLFVAMPNRRRPDGSFQDIAHPIHSTARQWLEKAVLNEYEHVLGGEHAGDADVVSTEEESVASGASEQRQATFNMPPR